MILAKLILKYRNHPKYDLNVWLTFREQSMLMANIAWLLEECSFMFVAPTERFWLPTVRTCSISETDFTTYDRRSFT